MKLVRGCNSVKNSGPYLQPGGATEISMGTQGMRYSNFRDLIADSMETVVQAMSCDAMITVVGYIKNMQEL
jgi:dihydroxy-acid dehydratase